MTTFNIESMLQDDPGTTAECFTGDCWHTRKEQKETALYPADATVEDKLGAWLSASLEDPNSCDEFKAVVNEWFTKQEAIKRKQQVLTCGVLRDILNNTHKVDDRKVVIYVRELDNWYDITQLQFDHKVLILRPDEENPR